MIPIKLKSSDLKLSQRGDGKTILSKDEKAIESRLDLCTRIKRRGSKRIRYGKRAAANVNRTP